MRILHISDTHGGLNPLFGRWDACIHTGDFLPNSKAKWNNMLTLEKAFQLDWIRHRAYDLKAWLRDHPFLFVLGNHDFAPSELVERELRAVGINAIDLTNKLITYQGVNFYGFPYVPAIDGSWNYEKDLPEMQVEVDKMVEQLNTTLVDVLCCHSPPYKTLDLTYGNELIGSTVLANALDYKIASDMMPPVYLCGHCHEANGITLRNGVLVSNAATTMRVVEV